MAKRLAPDSAGKEPDAAAEQSGLSERMRDLILRSATVEDRRNPGVGSSAGAVDKRRRRTDESSNESES
jgi:hypothetical protein